MDLSDRYSFLDRMLHRLAFSTTQVQVELADVEDRIFSKDVANIEVHRPVFITALPRAGTTVLLQVCTALDEFASHCYRDMPFVLLPMIWNGVSRHFRRLEPPTERAHGDGILVSPDSAEAFEEILWRAMWPHHYLPDRILPWSADDHPDFALAFTNHLKKVIKLRQRKPEIVPRYVSKNNANIGRIEWLLRFRPDAIIVVPVREPVQHAASLAQQHRRFLDLHARDRFARDYMEGIGHFDFGATLRPIDFGNWLSSARHPDPMTIEFWLEYWVAAHSYLLDRQRSGLHFFAYDRFCADSGTGLNRLADVIGVEDRQSLVAQRDDIRSPAPHHVDLAAVDPKLLTQARDIFQSLMNASVL